MGNYGEYQGTPFIGANEANRPQVRPKAPPQIDREVSEILGMSVPVNSSKLIKLVVKWKQQSKANETPDLMNKFLQDPEKIKELKQVFGAP